MPRVTISVCETCGNSFIMDLSDCCVPPAMPIRTRRQDDKARPIKTWADWIDHVSNHCEYCRYDKPPYEAVLDLERYSNKELE